MQLDIQNDIIATFINRKPIYNQLHYYIYTRGMISLNHMTRLVLGHISNKLPLALEPITVVTNTHLLQVVI